MHHTMHVLDASVVISDKIKKCWPFCWRLSRSFCLDPRSLGSFMIYVTLHFSITTTYTHSHFLTLLSYLLLFSLFLQLHPISPSFCLILHPFPVASIPNKPMMHIAY